MNTQEVLDDHLFNADFFNAADSELRGLYTVGDLLTLWSEGSIE